MAYTPVVPLGGYPGWVFLNRTLEAQKTAFAADPVRQRDEAYFLQRIGSVETAGQLVADRRLLRVALSAFGLEADIDSKAFVRRVLEDGTLRPEALANRLADKRYLDLSREFGFGDYATPRTQLSDFGARIVARFRERSFETAVGEQNGSFRLALNARSALPDLASGTGSDTAKWFGVLGSRPLREVFQTALGLPTSFALIDIDRQVAVLKEKAAGALGISSPSAFADPAATEKLIRLFLVRSGDPAAPAGSSQTAALQLLSRR